MYHPVPAEFNFSEVKAYIETLPAADSPELFGMNENAERAYRESQARTLIDGILNVQPRLAKNLIRYVLSRSSNLVLFNHLEFIDSTLFFFNHLIETCPSP